MHRLFVALRPPPATRAMLKIVMHGVDGARWQDDEQLHLTLRYIGEVERPVAEDVAAALAGVRAPVPNVTLVGVGRFDKRGRTDALWARVAPHDALAALHCKVDQALVRVGLAPERRAYLPHITLARMSRGKGAEVEVARWLADHAGIASQPFDLPYLTLYESHLGREATRYETIARWPMSGADGG